MNSDICTDKCMHCHKNTPTKVVRMYRWDGSYYEVRGLCDDCYELIMHATGFSIDPLYSYNVLVTKGDESCSK